MHDADHAGDVKHGHDQQGDHVGGGLRPQATGHRVVHEAGMRVHAALGQAGGAAGVGQHRQIGGARLQRRQWQAVVQGVSPGHHLTAGQGG